MPPQTQKKSAPPRPKYHMRWLCHACSTNGLVEGANRKLKTAVKKAHAATSPDCKSEYIATMKDVLPH